MHVLLDKVSSQHEFVDDSNVAELPIKMCVAATHALVETKKGIEVTTPMGVPILNCRRKFHLKDYRIEKLA